MPSVLSCIHFREQMLKVTLIIRQVGQRFIAVLHQSDHSCVSLLHSSMARMCTTNITHKV